MFKLNKDTKTKNGEIVRPILVEGNLVHCLTKTGRTIYKKLSDFNFDKDPAAAIEAQVITIVPKKRTKIISTENVTKKETSKIITQIKTEMPENEGIVESIKAINIQPIISTTAGKTKISTTQIGVVKTSVAIPTPGEEELQIIIGKNLGEETAKITSNYGNVEQGKVINNDDYI